MEPEEEENNENTQQHASISAAHLVDINNGITD